MTVLAPVSAGGHLAEFLRLLQRIDGEPSEVVFVTYDTPQVHATLPDSVRIFAHHPTTKNLPNAVRNYWLARRVFATMDIDQVVSTGAAVAVPFMIRATKLGIPCHYIESAARVTGPSLSGQMLQRLHGVNLYRQLGDWGEPYWQQGPSVFDGFGAEEGKARPLRKVVVSLGTHDFAFPALVERLAACFRGSGRGDLEVLWQLGSTPDPGGLPGRVVDRLSPDELKAVLADADVVVSHAGVGIALSALDAGKVPVLVPRRRSRREHTDDHQTQLAEELDRRGLAVVAEVDDLGPGHLERAASRDVTYDQPARFHLMVSRSGPG